MLLCNEKELGRESCNKRPVVVKHLVGHSVAGLRAQTRVKPQKETFLDQFRPCD